jgi:hypothetical protein
MPLADDVEILGWYERLQVWSLQWLAVALSYTDYVNILAV